MLKRNGSSKTLRAPNFPKVPKSQGTVGSQKSRPLAFIRNKWKQGVMTFETHYTCFDLSSSLTMSDRIDVAAL